MKFVAVVRFGRPNPAYGREISAEADRLLPGSTVTVGPFRYVISAERGLFLLCPCVSRGRFLSRDRASGRARDVPSRINRYGRPGRKFFSAKISFARDRGIRSSLFLSLILQVHRSKVANGYRTQGADKYTSKYCKSNIARKQV
ncbi:unnamed protein product [Microthlaspi erraticum]|uniref:Uncharacterized protein n=1 Tax=Microthlaspi erraticum TaxID=1685480 RepID=A0A6D2KLX4_9BRAS|nr:unnamed protein product [Microthlaspi erraticum]